MAASTFGTPPSRVVFFLLTAACLAMAPQQPTFRAGTDVVLVDTHVVGKDGSPVAGLTPEQFEVFIDGRRRPILSFECLRAVQAPAAATAPPTTGTGPAAPFSDGRVFVIGVDQPSFPMVAQSSAREAVRRVIEAVAPEDYLGLVAFPGKVIVAPTRDRATLRAAASQIQGLRPEIRPRFNVSATEAGLIKANDLITLRDVSRRECGPRITIDCQNNVKMDANQVITDLQRQAGESIGGMHAVIDGLQELPGRKTLLVISAGIPMSNRIGVEPNIGLETSRLAARAAAANVNLYVFYMNVHFLRAFSAEFGKVNNTLFQDIGVFGHGLERFAGSANGGFFQIEVNSDPQVARVMRETSAYYLLTVSTDPRERDGKQHFIRVAVKQRGATVRHRAVVTIPKTSS
jgi:VWFA-related protein